MDPVLQLEIVSALFPKYRGADTSSTTPRPLLVKLNSIGDVDTGYCTALSSSDTKSFQSKGVYQERFVKEGT